MSNIRVKKLVTESTINLRHLPPKPLPKSLTQAAGLLKGKLKKKPLKYQKDFRKEW